ncbi:regulatory protein, luxR family [Epibacterium ulvae]|uniref:Regulatory protein, luxR family n=1 Tax=Epibacterium ulvae TaxID=1156985 RepID=A0A1G5QIG9_9RHOB|nr:helix-turn-helix transcriptional regulator [Epibacterium ulvae]SCZ61623.1 regulatory protein, luxR family [Epibacterium ulvae]
MERQIRDMSGADIQLFAELIHGFSTSHGSHDPREQAAEGILKLLGGDTLASYVWDDQANQYANPVSVNRDDAAVQKYLTAFQYDDPLTARMRAFRGATLVEQVFPIADLAKTDFYHQYLRGDGMYHGMNIFHDAGNGKVVDLRIWRQKSRQPFERREIDLLDTLMAYLGPAFAYHNETSGQVSAELDSLALLSPREREIAQFVARGCTDRDISEMLGISFSTVRTHVNRCFDKLGCANRAELSARFCASLSKQLT